MLAELEWSVMQMIHTQIAFTLGAAILYTGFAGTLGVLLRGALRSNDPRNAWLLAALHGGLVFLPATVFISGLTTWSLWLRCLLLAAGAAALLGAVGKPKWLPRRLWQLSFAHRYLASGMICTSLWGLSLWISSPALTASLLAIFAGIAGAASLYTAPRTA
jgi:hypothetical protein